MPLNIKTYLDIIKILELILPEKYLLTREDISPLVLIYIIKKPNRSGEIINAY